MTRMSFKLTNHAIKRAHLKIYVCLLITFTTLSCANVLTPYLAETDSNAALLYEAKMLIDQRRYSAAQASLRQMTTAYFEQREVQVLYASTYAGLCGLDVINLILNLSAGSASSNTFFQLLFSAFLNSSATTVANCVTAERTLSAVIDSVSGTVDEHFLMVFISLAKIGAILNYSADSADQNGTIDAGYNKCTDAELTDLNVAEITVSLARIVISLTASGASISGLPNTSINTLCTTIDAIPGVSNPCQITNSATVAADASMVSAIRVVIAANEIGLKTCNDTTSNCLVSEPCP